MFLDEFNDKFKNLDRCNDKGIINSKTGSSIGIKESGDIDISSNKLAQIKINHSNNSKSEVFVQENNIINRKNTVTDEMIINYHKLNPAMYHLSDFKNLLNGNANIGMLTMGGTVLVKAWDDNLKKNVLIRRQIRTPIFSQTLDFANTPEQMGIE